MQNVSSGGQWSCLTLDLPAWALDSYAASLGTGGRSQTLQCLLQAIACSAGWQEEHQVQLVARQSPNPRIGIFGCFDPVTQARIEAQARQLAAACGHFLYLDFDQVAADCHRLADLLRQELQQELETAQFVAIPRGGWVVLGLLASALGLDADQLLCQPQKADQTLVVVDDCALSGARFHSFAADLSASNLVFAHLISHPDLRRACEASEPRVRACLAAHDLPAFELGAESDHWRQHWRRRVDLEQRYWLGLPVPMSLPWNEPDRQIWNPVSRQAEPAWSLAPPDRCSKNRARASAGQPSIHWLEPSTEGALRLTSKVLSTPLGKNQVVVAGASGRCFALEGVAAELWHSLVENGSLSPALGSLQDKFEVDAETLRCEADGFVASLLELGLVERYQETTKTG